MLIEHRGKTPSVHDSAYVAPTAVLCGDVVVGPGSRVLHGAVLTAEDGQVRIGRDVVIMENAVVKGRAGHPAVIGDFVLVGPHAHVNGADVRAGAFIATGASLFPGSVIGNGAEIRVNGVVQVNTTVESGSVVPIGWVAVGTPATVRAPDQHRDIWAVQRDLDFPGTVYGVPRGSSMRVIMASQSEFYGAHVDDVVVGAEPGLDTTLPAGDVPAEDVLSEASPLDDPDLLHAAEPLDGPDDLDVADERLADFADPEQLEAVEDLSHDEPFPSDERTEPSEPVETLDLPASTEDSDLPAHLDSDVHVPEDSASDEHVEVQHADLELDVVEDRDESFTEDSDASFTEDSDESFTREPDPAH